MFTLSEVRVLNALSFDLAQRGFGGKNSVERTDTGVVELIIGKKHMAGSPRQVHEVTTASFRDACDQIRQVIESDQLS